MYVPHRTFPELGNMGKPIEFVNYPGHRELEADGAGVLSHVIVVESSDTYADVKRKIMDAFKMKEGDTFGKVYLQQQLEIHDVDSMLFKDRKFLSVGAFDERDPIEVHFKRVPVLFLLFTPNKKTRRKVLHVDPHQGLNSMLGFIKEKFDLLPNIDIQLVHQGLYLPAEKRIVDFKNFDPAHCIKVLPNIFKEQAERENVPLQ